MWESTILYLVFGVFAGVAAGLFGVGGGIVIVPFLAWLFPIQGFPDELVMVMAVATSLSSIVVTSLSSVLAHHRLGAIRWQAVRRLVPGVALGALLGAVIAERLPVPVFKLTFGLFLILVALRIFARAKAGSRVTAPISIAEFLAVGGSIGLVSSILGIGGGTLSVPYLLRRGLPIRNAVAVSSACGFPIACAGTAAYLVLGWDRPDLPPLSAGYIYLPAFAAISFASMPFAPVGARLAHRLPAAGLKRSFAGVLVAVALRLLWQGSSAWRAGIGSLLS